MAAAPRIVHIGAGSTVFNPRLIADIARTPELRGATIVLVDTDAEAAERMARVGRRVVAALDGALDIESTDNRRRALAGAQFVITTIGVGGAAAWAADVAIPQRHGVTQTVGDSVGPGGVFRALRQIPVHVAIARDVAELAADAWLLNHSNPMTTIVRAVQRATNVRCIGLCHGIYDTRALLARAMHVPPEGVQLVASGVNHLSWVQKLGVGGDDAYGRLRSDSDVRARLEPVSRMLLDAYGLYPAPGDRHVAEFFPWFVRPQNGRLGHGLQSGRDFTDREISRRDDLRALLDAMANGTSELDPSLVAPEREPERVVRLMAAAASRNEYRLLAVNVANAGLVEGLPREAVVEVPGRADGVDITAEPVPPLPRAIRGVLAARLDQQELTVEAALAGHRGMALQALLADPLVTDVVAAQRMLDDSLKSNAGYLPQFA